MAIERQVVAPTTVAKVGAPPAKTDGVTTRRSAANSQGGRPRRRVVSAAASSGTVAQLRVDLAAARRDLALQKLDSPAKIRKLRKDLARALTTERAKAIPTATTSAKETA